MCSYTDTVHAVYTFWLLCFNLCTNAVDPVRVGQFNTVSHGVSGDVYVKQDKQLQLINFNCDGTGTRVFFWVGLKQNSEATTPDDKGIAIPDEHGSTSSLRRYDKANLTLTLPSNLTVSDLSYLSVWCDELSLNFGHVVFPRSVLRLNAKAESLTLQQQQLQPQLQLSEDGKEKRSDDIINEVDKTSLTDNQVPSRQDISVALDRRYFGKLMGPFQTLYHAVSGDVYAVNQTMINIIKFNYDGQGPGAYFWVGTETDDSVIDSYVPNRNGTKIPDEDGSLSALGSYQDANISLRLPRGLYLSDMAYLSVWCEDFEVDFGHVIFPQSLVVPGPHSLGVLSSAALGFVSPEVILSNSQQIEIAEFTCSYLQDGFVFVAGTDAKDKTQEADALIELDLVDGCRNVSEQEDRTETVVLRLAPPLTLFDIEYIGLYEKNEARLAARITLPNDLDLPPITF